MRDRGVLSVPAADYHDDLLGDTPTLSSSIAKILVAKTPAHARAQHPRLNPNFQRTESGIFDLGNVCHSILLEQKAILDVVGIVDADTWRTNAAKEQAAAWRAEGRIPLLAKHFDDVHAMVGAAREQIAAHTATPPLLSAGKPEQTLVWDEDGVVCRARLDWLRDDHLVIDDLKTTSASANPEQWTTRTMWTIGCDVQTAFYLRGLRAVFGVDAELRFLVIESAAPYALSVVSLGPDALALGETKVEYAIAKWRTCLASDSWPGYDLRVAYAEVPGWEESRWLERETREAA